MKPGDIMVVDFPYTNLRQTKIRPAVVITTTDDRYDDVVVALISSVVPEKLSPREIYRQASASNNLKVSSVIKTYRLATIESSRILSTLGWLSTDEFSAFVQAFHSLLQAE